MLALAGFAALALPASVLVLLALVCPALALAGVVAGVVVALAFVATLAFVVALALVVVLAFVAALLALALALLVVVPPLQAAINKANDATAETVNIFFITFLISSKNFRFV
ncbi:MAG: hypothetical protein N2Z23_06490 [Pyrinomonadaceae bacterium]|nr:hypothetical protein [Pyrinomonadaceae bacterium]MCX7640070.1 hypothetical protein [Pyrinomonadaceae bacterium]MDW8304242.1 hypothetical protein [Acidobacteriota bacterium]